MGYAIYKKSVYCGKFILKEQKQDGTGNIKCVKGSYDDGFYDGIEDQFYCKGCAENIVRMTISYGKEGYYV